MEAERERFHIKALPQGPVLETGSESFTSTRRATEAIRNTLSLHPAIVQEVGNKTPKPLFMVLVGGETVKPRRQTKEEKMVFNLDKFRKWVQPLVTIEQLKDMRDRWKNNFDNAYADQVLAILEKREDEIEMKDTGTIQSLDISQIAGIKSHIEERRMQELINKILEGTINQYITDYKDDPSWGELGRLLLIDAKKVIKEKYGKGSPEHIRAKDAYKKREDVNDNTSLLTKDVIDTDHNSITTTEEEHHTGNTQTETQSIPQKEEPRPQERTKESIVKRTNPDNRIAIQSDQLGLHVGKEFAIERFEQHMAGQSLKSNVNGSMAYITGKRTVLFGKGDNRKMYIVEILASEEIPIPNEPLPLPKTVKIMKIFKWNNRVAKK